jgi:hypothetical protein
VGRRTSGGCAHLPGSCGCCCASHDPMPPRSPRCVTSTAGCARSPLGSSSPIPPPRGAVPRYGSGDAARRPTAQVRLQVNTPEPPFRSSGFTAAQPHRQLRISTPPPVPDPRTPPLSPNASCARRLLSSVPDPVINGSAPPPVTHDTPPFRLDLPLPFRSAPTPVTHDHTTLPSRSRMTALSPNASCARRHLLFLSFTYGNSAQPHRQLRTTTPPFRSRSRTAPLSPTASYARPHLPSVPDREQRRSAPPPVAHDHTSFRARVTCTSATTCVPSVTSARSRSYDRLRMGVRHIMNRTEAGEVRS